MQDPYLPRRSARSAFVAARGLTHHVRRWGAAGSRPLVLLHGWMDVSASFQFVVDALRAERDVIAPDLRGFGLTERPQADSYWFPDYLADLEAVLDALVPDRQVDLVGHSMGGNVAMLYAGVRPQRVRTLISLEGFGMSPTEPSQAPARLARWLDEVREPARMRDYASLEEVAARLIRTNPRLAPGFARWLAVHWAAPTPEGRFAVQGDPAHKRVNPYLYRVDETREIWCRIAAPVLLVESEERPESRRFVDDDAYRARLSAIPRLSRATVADAGHMLHHDRPVEVAALIEGFVDAA